MHNLAIKIRMLFFGALFSIFLSCVQAMDTQQAHRRESHPIRISKEEALQNFHNRLRKNLTEDQERDLISKIAAEIDELQRLGKFSNVEDQEKIYENFLEELHTQNENLIEFAPYIILKSIQISASSNDDDVNAFKIFANRRAFRDSARQEHESFNIAGALLLRLTQKLFRIANWPCSEKPYVDWKHFSDILSVAEIIAKNPINKRILLQPQNIDLAQRAIEHTTGKILQRMTTGELHVESLILGIAPRIRMLRKIFKEFDEDFQETLNKSWEKYCEIVSPERKISCRGHDHT